MNVAIVSLMYDREQGSYDLEPLEEAVGDAVVEDLTSHVVYERGEQRLVLVVRMGDRGAGGRATAAQARVSWKKALAPEDHAVFEALREWRNREAAEAGLSPFLVLTNRSLAAVSEIRPRTAEALQGVEGIGVVKAERYGAPLLTCLRAAEETLTRARKKTA